MFMQKVLKTKNPSYNAQAQIDIDQIVINAGEEGHFEKWDDLKIYSDGCAWFFKPEDKGFEPSDEAVIPPAVMLAGIDLSIYDELDYASLNLSTQDDALTSLSHQTQAELLSEVNLDLVDEINSEE